jgi:hypothetical protein
MTVLDSKLTKSVGHFEENKFSVGCQKNFVGVLSKVDRNLQFWTKWSQLKTIKKQK